MDKPVKYEEIKDLGVVDLAEFRSQAIPKVGRKEPPDGDWLSPMHPGTEFLCRDKTGRTPRWLVTEFTHCGKLHGNVLLSPTPFLNDPTKWFWVEPILFCKEWEHRGVIEYPQSDLPPEEDNEIERHNTED